jgi:hypothetical protein
MNNDLSLFCKALNQIRRNMINEIKTAKIEANENDPTTGISPETTYLPFGKNQFRSENIEQFRNLAEALKAEYPQELNDTRVIYKGEGANLLENIKRNFTNKNRGPIGKVLGMPQSVLETFLSPQSGALYSATTDTVYSPLDNMGFLAHEFGHALDFNGDPVLPDDSFLKRNWKKLKHDFYPFSRRLPLGEMHQERKAWDNAEEGINRILQKHILSEIEENQLVDAASQIREPALATYKPFMIGAPAHHPWIKPILLQIAKWKAIKAEKNRVGKEEAKQRLLTGVSARESDKNKKDKNKRAPESKAAEFNANLRKLYIANFEKIAAVMDFVDKINPFLNEDKRFERHVDRRSNEHIDSALKQIDNYLRSLKYDRVGYDGEMEEDVEHNLEQLRKQVESLRSEEDRYKRYARSMGFRGGQTNLAYSTTNPAFADSEMKEQQGVLDNEDPYYQFTYHPNQDVAAEVTPDIFGGGGMFSAFMRKKDAIPEAEYDDEIGLLDPWLNDAARQMYLREGNKGVFTTVNPKKHKIHSIHVPESADVILQHPDAVKQMLDMYYKQKPLESFKGYTPTSAYELSDEYEEYPKPKKTKKNMASKTATFNANLQKLQTLNTKYCR